MISESRPIANIITNEPYMYKNQVMEKILKGKGQEVLRNKLIKGNMSKVEEHIKNVMGKEYKFTEIDADNKTYIRLHVNGTNILSQGSGFLQVTEIFSSVEYSEAAIYILLIDEPDSHIHMKLQKSLLREFKNIQNSQLFIITHNEKFLVEVDDNQILFIDEKAKEQRCIHQLEVGAKNLVLNNLVGEVRSIDRLKLIEKIVLVEGKADEKFFKNMLPKYLEYTGKEEPNVYISKINGIDTLNNKLLIYSTAFSGLVPDTAKWIVIRDSDCVPISRQEEVRLSNLGYLRANSKELHFQDGYGIESTFLAEVDKLAKFLARHYNINEDEQEQIIIIINEVNEAYATRVTVCTDVVHLELREHFNRQKEQREEKIYDSLELHHMLREITKDNIQYIMTKPILNMYFQSLHDKIQQHFTITADTLTADSILQSYYGNINSLEDIYDCHKVLLELLFS